MQGLMYEYRDKQVTNTVAEDHRDSSKDRSCSDYNNLASVSDILHTITSIAPIREVLYTDTNVS